jgi:CofD-related protein of GAK system
LPEVALTLTEPKQHTESGDGPRESEVRPHPARPDMGPRLLFLSGGTALRDTSRELKRFTHNSIHLVTPFDSGGSSAVLREAFGIFGVGDLRNRLMALAEDSGAAESRVAALFSHRFAAMAQEPELLREFEALVAGTHPLMVAIDAGPRAAILADLRALAESMPEHFDLRAASVGNLILVGGFLVNQRDIDVVLELFSRLVTVRGVVRPTSTELAHLVAVHAGGERSVGQHQLGKRDSLRRGRIEELGLCSSLSDGTQIDVEADAISLQLIDSAELIVFPVGSFFGSVLANLLPRGIGRRVRASTCPRVYVPNPGMDPEMRGYSVSGCARKIAEMVARDAGREVATREVLDLVLIDSKGLEYGAELDLDALGELGVRVIDTDLVGANSDTIAPRKLVEALLAIPR